MLSSLEKQLKFLSFNTVKIDNYHVRIVKHAGTNSLNPVFLKFYLKIYYNNFHVLFGGILFMQSHR